MTAPDAPRLTDADARRRIEDDTASTLFVDAGAGSGKTGSLIARIATLVLRDHVPLKSIAAITFTEKAGAELRDRLRARFDAEWRAATGEARETAAAALEDLDAAAIGTLHSFAQRILTMHPIEAGLPPLVEVLDEVGSSVAFDARWSVMQRELLDDDMIAPALRLGLAAGITLEHLRSLARAFQSDWDLVASHVLTDPVRDAVLPDIAPLVDEAIALAERGLVCTDPSDLFLPKVLALGAWAAGFADVTDPESALVALGAAETLGWGYGKAASWGGQLNEIKDACKDWQARAVALRAEVVNATLRPLARWVAERVLEAARDRASEGRLEFHDLLVVARDVLRSDASVRAALQHRFPRILLDEFQDTDPIQIEIAVRIAGGAGADAADWYDVDVPAGSLFVVGDPKQSIYRFRRADIAMYLRAQQRFQDTVTLQSNFRSGAALVDWVNVVFGALIEESEDAQPPYVPLAATQPTTTLGAPVTVLGAEPHLDKPMASTLRERESVDVAAICARAIRERWVVTDRRTRQTRPLALGDIAILVPARTSLPFLEDALDAAGIAYRAESSSLVYQAPEVRDLLAAARVVADPSDLLACVTALRSPLFGCGDDDLWTWKQGRGSFSIVAPPDGQRAFHPVAQGLAALADLHRKASWMAPSEVLGQLVRERRMLEVAATRPRARDQWRRLRFVVDQARAWSETEHGGLRGYLAWAARQAEETGRVAEAVLPETDVDAVRVMTIHAAKGLEFPMVVLSGMSSAPRNPSGVRVLWTPGGYEVRLSRRVQTNDFENAAPIDEQMDHYERRRLLYVAATRARDHLVVSMHRRADSSSQSNAELIASAGGAGVDGIAVFEPAGVLPMPVTSRPETAMGAPGWDEWFERLAAARRRSARPSAQSASGLEGTDPAVVFAGPSGYLPDSAIDPDDSGEAGSAKGQRDVDLPPWSKGRYGSAVGRAVHGVLQTIDLRSGDGLAASSAAQCVAEGVAEYDAVVAGLVRSALESDAIRRAADREYWRESYVGTELPDGTVLEGFVDLVYRDDDGSLVVVDYKTDAVPAGAIPSRVAYYEPQLRAYETAFRAATGARVRSVLVFLHPERPALEVPLP